MIQEILGYLLTRKDFLEKSSEEMISEITSEDDYISTIINIQFIMENEDFLIFDSSRRSKALDVINSYRLNIKIKI